MNRMLWSFLATLAIGTASRADDRAGHLEESFEAIRNDYKEAKEEARKQVIAARALELAQANPEARVAVDALIWVVGRRLPSLTTRALEVLRSDQIESDRLVAACAAASDTGLLDSLAGERLLREAISGSPHRRVRGMARFFLADVLEVRDSTIRGLGQNPEESRRLQEQLGVEGWADFSRCGSEVLTAEAGRLYEEIIADYADLNTSRKKPLGEVAQGRLFRLRRLNIGAVAPEIEGHDADGKPFRLGDYRGQVVVLTFSGNWCGSCRGFYPKEREFLARFKGKPFAVLSVNTDEDRETLRKATDSGEITWRCWWDGGTSGPITLRWGISYFPTIFILDHRGVIRFEQIEGRQLDEALDMLLKEAEAAKPGATGP